VTGIPVAASLDPDRLAPEADDPEVGSVMRDEVVFCLPSTPADAIAKLLADNILSEIVVLVDRRPVGFVVKEDVIARLVAGDIVVAGSDFAVRPPSTSVQARNMLQASPLLVDEHQRLSEVVALMAQHGRRLAIVTHEDETVVGMVTPRELADFRLLRRQAVHA
jgi:CBS domain-containing protein